MKDEKELVRTIRTLVAATKLNPIDLGIRINASEKSIYKWMNGSSMPSCAHVLRLMKLVDHQNEVLKDIRVD